jgi:release factor glutamine methyltransferase
LAEPALAGPSIRQALGAGAARLAAAGCETPRLDGEVLLASVLGVDRARLVIDAGVALDGDAAERFWAAVARREVREPVAYITGVREFRRLSLAVDPRVLIPRPETELLVEAGLELERGSSVVDVGTGSGAVALALKDERPDLVVLGVDVSPGAVEVARANALRHGLDVRFVEGDLLSRLGSSRFDGVLANLPYVSSDASDLPPEITSFEPALALFGGRDGLDVVRRLVATLGGVPFVALEIGVGQADVVSSLLSRVGFGSISRLRDLAGHERVIVGRR